MLFRSSLIIALENLYVKKRNIYAAWNSLVSCKQMSGENVRAYILRLNQLAKLCQFGRPESIEMNHQEWISQTFISGLVSRNMRSKLLEKELLVAEDVYQMGVVTPLRGGYNPPQGFPRV